MSMAKDIADYLETNALGSVGTDVFYGDMPDQPDSVIGVFKYAGRTPLITSDIDRPGLQVRARGPTYETVQAKIKSVEDLLRQIGDEYNESEISDGALINGTFYLRIAPIQSAFPLGRDGKERIEFAQNYQIDIRR